jgi:hypothetical protein
MDLHLLDLLGHSYRSYQTLAKVNHLDQDHRHRHYILHTIHLGHHFLTGHLTLEVPEALTRTTINLMDRVTKGIGMNVAMDHHHEEGEGDPNRVVGKEEAVDEIGIEEGIEIEIRTGTGEIGQGILVGRREVGEEEVLGGVNALGHENLCKSLLRLSDRDKERFAVIRSCSYVDIH